MQYRVFEPEIRWIDDYTDRERLARGTALDVGAWWGPWMYWLSRRAARVVSVEPVPHVAEFLRRVAPDNVEVVHSAVSDHTGTTTLFLPDRGKGSEGYSTLEQDVAVSGAIPIEVPLTTIDELAITDAAFVKIDVEGHELPVLDGARETLTAQRPPVLIEIEARGTVDVDAVFDRLLSYGYDGWFHFDKAWRPLSEFDLERHQLATQESVRSRGFVGNMLHGTSKYVHNFVFSTTPPR